MSDDTKALIERLQLHQDNKTKRAMQRDGEQAAATIARLEAERDAARAAIAEYLAAFDGADDPRAVGSTCRLIRAEGALRAAANSQENQHVTGVCRPSEQQSERDAARREAMEECARICCGFVDPAARYNEAEYSAGAAACAAAIRAAMKGEQ